MSLPRTRASEFSGGYSHGQRGYSPLCCFNQSYLRLQRLLRSRSCTEYKKLYCYLYPLLKLRPYNLFFPSFGIIIYICIYKLGVHSEECSLTNTVRLNKLREKCQIRPLDTRGTIGKEARQLMVPFPGIEKPRVAKKRQFLFATS